jgi:hypothetical protein
MMNMSKRKSVAIVALVAIALVLVMALPSVAFATDDATQGTRVLRARGVAFEQVEIDGAKMPANLTLVLEPGTINRGIITFKVVSGEVDVDGKVYTITEGKGFVAYRRRLIAMQFNGTGPEGETLKVKLGGRYFWLWGRVHVARLAGTLEAGNLKLGLLLRAALRPEA